jgi:CRISPR/Cas system-associated protein Cas10 (large subunit of type III CRISPR-Cas system)
MTKRIYPGEMAPPSSKTCDWCGEKAAKGFELKKNRKPLGTALFLYACNQHTKQAEEAAAGYKAPKKKAEKIVIKGPGE